MPTEIFPYQDVGARFLAERDRAGLFDEMRVGKSAQAIRALDLTHSRRGIVICPAIAREVWRGEFAKFGIFKRDIIKGVDIHDFVAWMRGRFDVLVTSFEQATRWAKRIHEMGEVLDFCIIDEGHYLKNSEAARTKAILGDYTVPEKDSAMGIVAWAKRCWILTGTPMANDPMDIYTFLRFCRAMPLQQGVFAKRYFHTFEKQFGSRNTPRKDVAAELRRLIENNSMRRTQKEAGLQFPPIFLTNITLDGDTSQVAELLKQYPGLDRSIVHAVEAGGLSFLDAQHIATLRRLVGEAKAVPYAQLLFEELQNTAEKYVVMGIHKEALKSVQDFLLRKGITSVLINGDVPDKMRSVLIAEFQNNPEVRVCIFNLKAGGTATSMTAGNNIDVLEGDWAPGPNAQGIMRVQGMSQKLNIRCRFVTLANSIDEAVNRIVAGKTEAILNVMGQEMQAHPPIDLHATAA